MTQNQLVAEQMQPEGHERRQHPRFAITAKGRFLAGDGTEHDCSIRDMSLGGIALNSDVEVSMGDHIIVYLDEFGRFEGNIVRIFGGGFAITTAISGPRRERLQARLDSIAKGVSPAEAEAEAKRAFPRYAPKEAGMEESSVVTLEDGRTAPCRIVDMSLGGANVATELKAPLGSNVSIGRMKGRVVRHTAEGIAIEFTDIPERASALSRPFG